MLVKGVIGPRPPFALDSFDGTYLLSVDCGRVGTSTSRSKYLCLFAGGSFFFWRLELGSEHRCVDLGEHLDSSFRRDDPDISEADGI